MTTFALTVLALIAFAANSLLCRLALVSGQTDPLAFTLIRLLSGVVALLPILIVDRVRSMRLPYRPDPKDGRASFLTEIAPSAFLFCYALTFSLAYRDLGAATGALVLFVSVQLTMTARSLFSGHKFRFIEGVGMTSALAGLVFLLMPGLHAPPIGGTLLMIFAGISWGGYSVLGKSRRRPIIATARNFLYCLPGCLILAAILSWQSSAPLMENFDTHAATLAFFSGALASGYGYVLWYLAIGRISVVTAAIVQLAAPILVGIGGVIFLHEAPSARLFVSATLIVGGIFAAIWGKNRKPQQPSPSIFKPGAEVAFEKDAT